VGCHGLNSDAKASHVREAAASQIFKYWNIPALTQFDKLLEGRPFRKTNHAEIAWMHTQQEAREVVDRFFIILDARAVCRADLAQTRPAASHDFGNPKGIPDLDLLSTGSDYFAALTQCVQYQKDCSRIVIHHDGGFGAEQLTEYLVDVYITLFA